ncbi:MAG: carboxypeptidase-like regulatory domain-containing protein [Bryobacteraceae bacterium]
MITNAKILVTETHTGTKIAVVSDSSGAYNAPFLLPGDYDISAQAAGFKEFVRRAVHVGAGDHPVVDIQMQIGQASQAIEVTANSEQLNTENATTGQTVTTKEVAELPLNGRTPITLAALSLGVMATGQPGLIHPFDAGGAVGWSVGGAHAQASELLMNGAPNGTWDGRQAYSPPQDAVLEVEVRVFDSDAAFGHTGGGTLNQILKSGTNGFHGSAYEFVQPFNLDANDFFLNRNGKPRQSTHLNQYGLTAGGPILIPKVVDSRNRVFWFFAWDNMKDSSPISATLTVPTPGSDRATFPRCWQPTARNRNSTTPTVR